MPPLARIRKVSSVTSLQINYFLCVVKHMSFTKAAAEMYITQPSLSKQISNLETELGVRLFDRSVKTQLRLTPAGITMRDFFARSRDDFTQALQKAQEENGTLSGTLRIGVIEGLDFIRKIQPLIARWEAEYPNVQLVFERQPLEKLNHDLLAGSYDLCIQLYILACATPGLKWEIIDRKNGLFLYSAQNPLAQRHHLEPADFQQDPFYVLDADGGGVTRAADIQYCQSLGFTPILVPMPNDDSILHAISAGRGFGLFHPWCWYVSSQDFRWIETTQPIPLCIAWKEHNRRELTHVFRRDVAAFFQSGASASSP